MKMDDVFVDDVFDDVARNEDWTTQIIEKLEALYKQRHELVRSFVLLARKISGRYIRNSLPHGMDEVYVQIPPPILRNDSVYLHKYSPQYKQIARFIKNINTLTKRIEKLEKHFLLASPDPLVDWS